ncbi:TlpA family protein disulfide reductase [Fodinicola feengrottensis]|uniref:TlpA family protein disulfide reductase n=1 Tax=Fodinicola feengrottensis TaxID=435914 RepID=UPI0013D6EE1E|nr:redoxin domain-containing protein [Fodinicola feengrottensis]
MSAVVAAVAVVGALSVVNLLLCIGIVRRLREHTEILNTQLGDSGQNRRPAPMYATGQRIAEFTATTVDGADLSRALMTGTTMVGFFTPGCSPCKERMPLFIEQAANHDRDQVLAVVAGTPDASAEYVAKLAPVARVVRENDNGPVAAASA